LWKTRQVIADLQHLGRPIEGLWRFQCSVDRAQRLYPPVQVAQQAIDCFGDFSGYHS